MAVTVHRSVVCETEMLNSMVCGMARLCEEGLVRLTTCPKVSITYPSSVPIPARTRIEQLQIKERHSRTSDFSFFQETAQSGHKDPGVHDQKLDFPGRLSSTWWIDHVITVGVDESLKLLRHVRRKERPWMCIMSRCPGCTSASSIPLVKRMLVAVVFVYECSEDSPMKKILISGILSLTIYSGNFARVK